MSPSDSTMSRLAGWMAAVGLGGNSATKSAPQDIADRDPGDPPSVQNSANFSGEYNYGLQVGQNIGGNIAHTINVYPDRNSPQDFERSAEYVQSLSSRYRQQKNANPRRTPRTCQWFLDDDRYRWWHETEDAHLLHVFAAPGCGKSVLARALIDESLLANERTSAVLYYFFKSGQGDQDRSATAIAAFLHQLYNQIADPTLKTYAKARYEAHGAHLREMFEELWDIFIETAAHVSGNIVCVLDALDECNEQDRPMLISEIASYFSNADTASRWKLLVLSRPYRAVDFYPGPIGTRANFIRFDGDGKSDTVAQEINRVIEDQVPLRFSGLSQMDQKEIINHLQRRENRTYLWLYLVLEYAQKRIAFHGTSKGLMALLSELPPEVSQVYEKMLDSSPYPELTRRLLSIVLAAIHPLTIDECNAALAVAQMTPIGDNDIFIEDMRLEPQEQFRKSLGDLCGLLLTVRDSRVYFIHETAREFLLPQRTTAYGATWKTSFDLKSANGLFAEICVTYLSFRVGDDKPKATVFSEHFVRTNSAEAMKALGTYARAAWTSHYARGESEKLLWNLRQPWSKILEQELDQAASSNWARKVKAPPLHCACAMGFERLVQLLLELGANVNGRDYEGESALVIALQHRSLSVLPVLIVHDVDISVARSRMFRDYGVPDEILGRRVPTLVAAWSKAKPRQALPEELFRVAVANCLRLKDTKQLQEVFDYPLGFVAHPSTICSALYSMEHANYITGVRMLVGNRVVMQAIEGTPAYDAALAAANEDRLDIPVSPGSQRPLSRRGHRDARGSTSG